MLTALLTKLQRKLATRLYRRSARMIGRLEAQQRFHSETPPEDDQRVQSIIYMIKTCKDAQECIIVAQLSTCLRKPSENWANIRTAHKLLNHVDEIRDSLLTPAH